MALPYNFSIYFTDGGLVGAGPYSASVRLNPSTPPSGGTDEGTFPGTGANVNPNQNIAEVAIQAVQFIRDVIANANQTDTDN